MQALVFRAETGPQLEQVPQPVPTAQEVLLQVGYCGICGTDLHACAGDFADGVVMGHEFSGTIVALGEEVTQWQVGDRVAVNPNGVVCGECDFCRRGQINLCQQREANNIGQNRNGGIAEYVALEPSRLHRLPDQVSLLQGAWTEPLAVAVRTVSRAELTEGDRAIVFGAGPIGLLVLSVLKARGVAAVVVERSRARGEVARQLGAAQVLNPDEVDLPGRFADPASAPTVAFECTGVAGIVDLALAVLRPTGRLVVTGYSRTPPTYASESLLFKELQIRASFIYRDQEFPAALELLRTGAVDVELLTSGVVPVSQALTAFAGMRQADTAIKYAIGNPRV
ncbi:MAG: zinc-binding dehydrogenase [Beutenbergiaceae bacterium]